MENDESVSVSTEATENQTLPSIQDESSKDDIKVPTTCSTSLVLV